MIMATQHKISPGTHLAALVGAAGSQPAHALGPIVLPPPRQDFGVSLAKALWARRSTRAFDPARKLSPQTLSELLWCAYGVNRPGTADRTAPSWRHACETDIFAAMEDGVWRYEPVSHRLLPHLARDVRAETGTQAFAGRAPLDLIYVSNRSHLAHVSPEEQYRLASTDAGFIGQNVYLYCASEGLATAFHASYDPGLLARSMRLRWTQFFITFVQTVGYPES